MSSIPPNPPNQPSQQPSRMEQAKAVARRRFAVPVWGLAALVIGACLFGDLIGHAGASPSVDTSSGNVGAVVSSATNTPAKPKATATPTATPKPKAWVTVQHFSGSANTQTPTFSLPDGSRIVWSAKASDSFGGNFAVEMDNSDGTYNDLVANTTTPPNQGATYTVHGDLNVFLKVQTYGCNWDIQVQEYK